MSSHPFGSSKQHGVICIHPGCFRFLQTTKYKQHYEGNHLQQGEVYVTAHRERFERALLDPDLLDWGDDGPLKAVFVASLVRISHSLDEITTRLQRLEEPSPAPPPSPPTVAPAAQPVVSTAATNAPTVTPTPDEHVEESAEEEEEPEVSARSKKRTPSRSTKKPAKGKKQRKK